MLSIFHLTMTLPSHVVYLNAYQLSITSRTRPGNRELQSVDSRYPVVGGFADVSMLEITDGQSSGHPLSEGRIQRGDVVCHHFWKAQGPAGKGQYFCVGWIKSQDCKEGRNPRTDGLDCGFHFNADQVRRGT